MLLVTGITGHSGRYFLQELINNKYEGSIRCVVRNGSDTSLIDKSGLSIEKVTGDLTDQDFVDSALDGADTVLHIATIFHSLAEIKASDTRSYNRYLFTIQERIGRIPEYRKRDCEHSQRTFLADGSYIPEANHDLWKRQRWEHGHFYENDR